VTREGRDKRRVEKDNVGDEDRRKETKLSLSRYLKKEN